jgi:outer membrane protein TolC
MKTRFPLLLPLLALAGCAVGPNYKRPATPVPPAYRGAPPGGSAASLADTKWTGLFEDDPLNQLIAEALRSNLDLAIAVERVEQARARYRIAGASQFPFVFAQGQFTASRPSRIGSSLSVPSGSLD